MPTNTLRRMIISGAKSFARSGAVTFASVLIMTVTLVIIGGLLFVSAILTSTLDNIKDKVDVNVYFVTTASESDILALSDKLKTLPEVVSVTYTSREDALAAFEARHAEDQLTLQALEELGENPLGASLSIKAKEPSQYESVARFLNDVPALSSTSGAPLIDRVNYLQNKVVIDRLTGAVNAAEGVGLVIVLIFALASIVIAFATIRLAIHTSRDEIGVMRLVGASNAYIRGPFLVAGVMTGLIAAVITLLIFYPLMWYAGSATEEWLGGFSVFSWYLGNFLYVFSVLIFSGIGLGAGASYLAVRRYLKV